MRMRNPTPPTVPAMILRFVAEELELPLSEERVVGIAIKLCQGNQYAHMGETI